MKRITIVVLLAVTVLFFHQPKADAGAIAIIPREIITHRAIFFSDDRMSERIVGIAKQYLPDGYTIHCGNETTQQCYDAAAKGYNGHNYAYTYGYDYVIYLQFEDPYMETVHFNHPRAQFEIYEMSIGTYATVIDQYNMDSKTEGMSFRKDTAEKRMTPKELHDELVYVAVDAMLYHCGKKIHRDLYGDPKPAPRPNYW